MSLIPKQVTVTSKIALVAINPGNARLARFDLVAAVRARSSAEPRPLGYLRPGLNRTEIEAQLPVEDDRTCECPIFPSRRPAAFLISVPTERVRSLFYPRPIAIRSAPRRPLRRAWHRSVFSGQYFPCLRNPISAPQTPKSRHTHHGSAQS